MSPQRERKKRTQAAEKFERRREDVQKTFQTFLRRREGFSTTRYVSDDRINAPENLVYYVALRLHKRTSFSSAVCAVWDAWEKGMMSKQGTMLMKHEL